MSSFYYRTLGFYLLNTALFTLFSPSLSLSLISSTVSLTADISCFQFRIQSWIERYFFSFKTWNIISKVFQFSVLTLLDENFLSETILLKFFFSKQEQSKKFCFKEVTFNKKQHKRKKAEVTKKQIRKIGITWTHTHAHTHLSFSHTHIQAHSHRHARIRLSDIGKV